MLRSGYRVAAAAMALMLAASALAGCGNDGGEKPESEAAVETEATVPAVIYSHTDITPAGMGGAIFGMLESGVPDVEPIPEYLKNGTKHWCIPELQERLMDLGFMDPDEPTDYYGDATESAVKKFQRQTGLKQDGVTGPETYAAIMADDAKHYTVKLDDDGEDIALIQQRLYQLGYLAEKGQITGHFGEKTEEAVKRLQENNGLKADGLVGLQTVNLIYSDEVKANMLTFGEESELVLAAQRRLFDLGYMTSTPDGKYGGDTGAAVKTFQAKNGLIVDGYLGPDTRDFLLSSQALPNGLGLGDEGDTVKKVQTMLAKLGYLGNSNATGYFGEKTLSAVKAFQKRNGLTADGLVGKKTMDKLTGGKAKGPAPAATGGGGGSTQTTTAPTQAAVAAAETTAAAVQPAAAASGVPDTNANGVSGSVSAMLALARTKLGCRYSYGAKGPERFDCSGFVYWVLNNSGVTQSYITSAGWRNVGKYTRISSYNDLRAGDVIVVNGHVGFISTDGNVLDASSSNGRVIERPLGSWWANHFIVGWRIF